MGWTTLHKRVLVATATILIFFVLVHQLPSQLSRSSRNFAPDAPPAEKSKPHKDDPLFEGINLSKNFKHLRREFVVYPSAAQRRSTLQYISHPFLQDSDHTSDPHHLVLAPFSHSDLDSIAKDATINIPVPSWKPKQEVDSSELLFGAATSLKRLNETCVQWARWLGHTNATVVVIIQEETKDHKVVKNYRDGNWTSVEDHVRDVGINVIMVPYLSLGQHHDARDGEAVRHLAISEVLYEHREPWHKWFVVIDDDTFFTSLSTLQRALAPFDASKPQWIGAMTENWMHKQMFGRMAYGGAGMIISLPTLRAVAAQFPFCNWGVPGGDMLFRLCIEQSTELIELNDGRHVQLNELSGLNQLDLRGDLAGFYESGRHPLVSVHHYNSWHHHPIMQTHLVTDVAGPDAFLQRYRFSDDIIFTNGFSIVQYAKNASVDLTQIERTFEYEEGQFEDALGTLRDACKDGYNKTTWRFERSVRGERKDKEGNANHGVGRETVRQLYLRRGRDDHPDSVFELTWIAAESEQQTRYDMEVEAGKIPKGPTGDDLMRLRPATFTF